ncbi:MAG: arylsulfatase, partial [Myxococcota bacterium]
MRRAALAASALVGVAGVAAALVMGWSDTEVRAPAPSDAPPMATAGHDSGIDVVLVIGCTVRRDQTEPYGAPPGVTPFLAELAAQGAAFDDGLAAAPWTKAAAIALLTGRHAVGLGMVEPGDSRNERILPDEVPTLAERLSDAGYVTVGGTHNPNLDPIYGLHRGFDTYLPTDGRIRDVAPRGQDLVDAALEAMDEARQPGSPTFLQLVLVDAHTPRTPSPAERAAVPHEGVPEQVATYRATLRRLDDALARLDDGLRVRGMTPENTLFVFVADHGEGLAWPPHHGDGHGFHLGPSVTSIPWILRGPGVPEGTRMAGLASQVDLVPTLFGLLGLPPVGDAGLAGVDLSGTVRGELGSTPRKRAYIDTRFYDTNRAAQVNRRFHCQADFDSEGGRRRIPLTTGCFDRSADPEHARPVQSRVQLSSLAQWRT